MMHSMSRCRSQSTPTPLTPYDIPLISQSPSPDYQSPNILSTPVIPAPTFNQTNDAHLSFLCDQISQLPWSSSSSHFSLNPSTLPTSSSTSCHINITPADISEPVPSNAGTIESTVVEAKRRRRTQNREAQRKFRERKDNYLKSLKEKAKRLDAVDKKCEELERKNAELKLRLESLERN